MTSDDTIHWTKEDFSEAILSILLNNPAKAYTFSELREEAKTYLLRRQFDPIVKAELEDFYNRVIDKN